MKGTGWIIVLILWSSFTIQADEGMFPIGKIDTALMEKMSRKGLLLSSSQISNTDRLGLKDAVVMFDNGCTGAVVSDSGLIITNHHCGYDAVQKLSTTTNNYLKAGFSAPSTTAELPVAGVTVSFLRRMEEVSSRIIPYIDSCSSELNRKIMADSIGRALALTASEGGRYVAEVLPFYEGNAYFLSVYEVYTDVRLVVAPPSYVGKFGGETDNWMWPRLTGDFSLFRVYANVYGRPADYSELNVPLHTAPRAKISLNGYQEGSFAMTIGFPGDTKRYLTACGVEELMETENQTRVEVRTLKQGIWAKQMALSAEIRLKYAAKYAASSNYWKYSIGQLKQVETLGVLDRISRNDSLMEAWINTNGDQEMKPIYKELRESYAKQRSMVHHLHLLAESLKGSSDLVQLADALISIPLDGDEESLRFVEEEIESQYSRIDFKVDKEVLKAMIDLYAEKTKEADRPDFYAAINDRFKGNSAKFVDHIYAKSVFLKKKKLLKWLRKGKVSLLEKDPLWEIAFSIQMKEYDFMSDMADSNEAISRAKRLLMKERMKIFPDSLFYPDANFTMRLSYGAVLPIDGVEGCYTITDSILPKSSGKDDEFFVGEPLLTLVKNKDYGRYANPNQQMPVALLTTNDITGGNSGSPLFNGHGELIGVAFDGNWEGMSGDVAYNAALQRTINVDIRYVLFIIEKLMKNPQVVKEMLQQ